MLTSRIIQAEIHNKKKEKKEKLLKEVIVKIRLKQKDEEERITIETLLDSGTTRLVVSLEFMRKHKFKKKLKRLIYMKNMNNIFNYKELINHIVEVELSYREYKEKTEIDVIENQK